MTVNDLAKFLNGLPGDMQIAYRKFSEQEIMDIGEIEVVDLCESRPDGWVQNYRPDKKTEKYLLFPGN